MNILFASSELTPYAKSGGLGEVASALPAALSAQGHSVSVVVPLYRRLRETFKGISKTELQLHVSVDGRDQLCSVWQGASDKGVTVFAIQRDEFFDRGGLYGNEEGDYFDNAARYSFFCRAVVELAKHIEPLTDVIHVNDWHAALVPAYVRSWGMPFKTLLTIHTLAYQGSFADSAFAATQLHSDYFSPQGVEFYGRLNFLKGGILLADAITTVSPNYANEIQTETYGFGLQNVLREQSRKLSGIINGIDAEEWNPETDAKIAKNFSAKSILGKAACKKDVIETFGFAGIATEEKPKKDKVSKATKGKKEAAKTKAVAVKAESTEPALIGIVSRLVGQKGMDLVLESLEKLLERNVRFVVMGDGDESLEKEFLKWGQKRPDRVAVKIGYDDKLAHKIFAGSDFVLVPSLFEPCGLSQLYALRYGAVPIVRQTGGLADTVEEWDGKVGTGFKFVASTTDALLEKVDAALAVWADKKAFAKLRKNGLSQDHSWKKSVGLYESLYQKIVTV